MRNYIFDKLIIIIRDSSLSRSLFIHRQVRTIDFATRAHFSVKQVFSLTCNNTSLSVKPLRWACM